jgi:hypothetical protein
MMDVSRHKSVDTLRGYVRDAELFKDHAGAEFDHSADSQNDAFDRPARQAERQLRGPPTAQMWHGAGLEKRLSAWTI